MLKNLPGILLALALVGTGAGAMHLVGMAATVKPETSAKIIGPDSIAYAGQYAAYHVTTPGKDPGALIFTWSVEPLCPAVANAPLPAIRATKTPGEAQLDTVAGRWRISAAIADPSTKSGQVVSLEVTVPHESPVPGPVVPIPPVPQPAPPGPLPLPGPSPGPLPPPTPEPGTRFSQFTSDVTQWLAAVVSPDKANETSLIASGADAVATSLRTGTLSHLSGLSLRIAVASEVLSNNNKVKNTAAWSQFGQNVNAAATAAVKANQLNSASDWADFLTAFEKGLKP